jgi:Fic-DOC domain mobile mystery protein B
MSIEDDDLPGATPFSLEDLSGLIPDLSTRAELNIAEQRNITRAVLWAQRNRRIRQELLSIPGLCRLHEEMFKAVWRWAGRIRSSEKNIGVPAHTIREQTVQLCENTRLWIAESVFPWPEIAVRFHHRLVEIHVFHNGNGRHARLASDLLLRYHGQPQLPWGGDRSLVESSPGRTEYITALEEADSHDLERLLRFATSTGDGNAG